MSDRHIVPLTRALVGTAAEGRPIEFHGYASVFGERAWIGPDPGGFWEEIIPGAFSRAVKEDDVRFLVNHDPGRPLSRVSAGNLRLSEDERGLAVEAEMVPTRDALDVAMLIRSGVLNQMSFAFLPDDQKWDVTEDGEPLRLVRSVRPLADVSVVAYPAYEGTAAALRTAAEVRCQSRTNHLQVLRARLEAAYGRSQ